MRSPPSSLLLDVSTPSSNITRSGCTGSPRLVADVFLGVQKRQGEG